MELTENDIRALIPMNGGARDGGGESSDGGIGEGSGRVVGKPVGGVGGGGHVEEGRDGAGRCGGGCDAGRRADGQNQTGVTRDRDRRRGGGSGGDRRDKQDGRGERDEQARGDYYWEIINVDNYFSQLLLRVGIPSLPDLQSFLISFGYSFNSITLPVPLLLLAFYIRGRGRVGGHFT